MDAEESRHRRDQMIHLQIEHRGIHDPAVLHAMRIIPRELFVPPERQREAYWDGALSIGMGQTISQPYIVALMTCSLELKKDDVVLEVGTGSGYQTAILSRLCRWVYTIERLEALSQQAGKRLERLGVENFTLLVGDGTLGFPHAAPYDGIIVTAAAPRTPQSLCEQLASGGKIVIPVGDRSQQVLYQIRRQGDEFVRRNLGSCVFVPLIGQEGWGAAEED